MVCVLTDHSHIRPVATQTDDIHIYFSARCEKPSVLSGKKLVLVRGDTNPYKLNLEILTK